MPWSSYDEAQSEQGTIDPPLRLGYQNDEQWNKLSKKDRDRRTFVFPKHPPASFGLQMLNLITKTNGKVSDAETLLLLPEILKVEDIDRLVAQVTDLELHAIIDDLLTEYGWKTKAEEATPPNRAARRTQQRQSRKDSARSKQTGNASTPTASVS